MKLKFEGKVGKQEIVEAIFNTLTQLEKKGVNEFGGVNFYANLYMDGEKGQIFFNGTEIDMCYVSKRKHITSSTVDGETVVKYNSPNHSEYEFNENANLRDDIVFKAESEIKREEREWQIQRELRLEQEAKIAREKAAIRAEEDRKIKAYEDLCCENMKNKLNLTNDEFRIFLSSKGILKTEKGIQKYTDKDVGPFAYRITMKKSDKTESIIYIFDSKGNIAHQEPK